MPNTGHFILHSNVMPPITAGPYELRTCLLYTSDAADE